MLIMSITQSSPRSFHESFASQITWSGKREFRSEIDRLHGVISDRNTANAKQVTRICGMTANEYRLIKDSKERGVHQVLRLQAALEESARGAVWPAVGIRGITRIGDQP